MSAFCNCSEGSNNFIPSLLLLKDSSFIAVTGFDFTKSFKEATPEGVSIKLVKFWELKFSRSPKSIISSEKSKLILLRLLAVSSSPE